MYNIRETVVVVLLVTFCHFIISRSCQQELSHIEKVLNMFDGAAAGSTSSDNRHRLISIQSHQRNAVSHCGILLLKKYLC